MKAFVRPQPHTAFGEMPKCDMQRGDKYKKPALVQKTLPPVGLMQDPVLITTKASRGGVASKS